jgi:hypothetical protein
MPNAFYTPTNNEVLICPQFLNLPDAALFATISHELGHAIDPCTTTYTYSRAPGGNLELNLPDYLEGAEPKNTPPELPAIRPEINPLKNVVACLKEPTSLGAKVPTMQNMLLAIDKDEAALRAEAAEDGSGELGDATMAGFEDQRNAIRNHYSLYQNCGKFSGNGHIQEAFSDWLASQTIADKISELKSSDQIRQYAFESQAVFWGVGCENVKQAVHQHLERAAGPGCSNYEAAVKSFTSDNGEMHSSHPTYADRINRIVFASPEMRKALGCQATGDAKECL